MLGTKKITIISSIQYILSIKYFYSPWAQGCSHRIGDKKIWTNFQAGCISTAAQGGQEGTSIPMSQAWQQQWRKEGEGAAIKPPRKRVGKIMVRSAVVSRILRQTNRNKKV